jgi:cellulose synthase/poly-beta-1,6-N-acetylglucosamine synthase-like glycosyltransferase
MNNVSTIIFYILAFISMYVQIFFLITFFEKRKKIEYRKGVTKLDYYPTVAVAVPCWNEEKTVEKTLNSLLAMDYPKDRLTIIAVDDGSTDNTWEVLKKFEKYPNIKIIRKENGGKHTAVNYAIENSESEFISCLDADSFVDPQALNRIISYFQKDPKTMAVAPSILIDKPKSFTQVLQKVEYEWAVFLKKVLGMLGGIYVTPGPFSVFRREVFTNLGLFRKAHNTEDMEIAFRMQKNHYKIDQCNDAFVYTTGPKNVLALYKQRLRWIYGFIMNTLDYKHLLFKKEYGTFSMLAVPAGFVSIIAVPYILGLLMVQIVKAVVKFIEKVSVTGFDFNFSFGMPNFDTFFLNTNAYVFTGLVLYLIVMSTIIIGKRMATGKYGFDLRIILFMFTFSFIAPFWVMKAIYNAVFAKKTAWR